MSRHKIVKIEPQVKRGMTKSEELLSHVGELVSCEICHKLVTMSHSWCLTAVKNTKGDFINKKTVCPNCQSEVVKSGALIVSI